jgi:hypothetical protein
VSANNWAVCPRCIARARKRESDQLAKVMASYGKIPVEQFDHARKSIEPVEESDYRTFREDYEFYGAETGTIEVSYSGHCGACGLGLDFQQHHEIPEYQNLG